MGRCSDCSSFPTRKQASKHWLLCLCVSQKGSSSALVFQEATITQLSLYLLLTEALPPPPTWPGSTTSLLPHPSHIGSLMASEMLTPQEQTGPLTTMGRGLIGCSSPLIPSVVLCSCLYSRQMAGGNILPNLLFTYHEKAKER